MVFWHRPTTPHMAPTASLVSRGRPVEVKRRFRNPRRASWCRAPQTWALRCGAAHHSSIVSPWWAAMGHVERAGIRWATLQVRLLNLARGTNDPAAAEHLHGPFLGYGRHQADDNRSRSMLTRA